MKINRNINPIILCIFFILESFLNLSLILLLESIKNIIIDLKLRNLSWKIFIPFLVLFMLFLMLWKITDGRVINKWYKITKVKVFTNTDSKDGVFWIQIPKIANIRNITTKTSKLIIRVRRSLFLFFDFCCFVNVNWKWKWIRI